MENKWLKPGQRSKSLLSMQQSDLNVSESSMRWPHPYVTYWLATVFSFQILKLRNAKRKLVKRINFVISQKKCDVMVKSRFLLQKIFLTQRIFFAGLQFFCIFGILNYNQAYLRYLKFCPWITSFLQHVKLCWGHLVFRVALGLRVEAKIHYRDRT